MESTKEPVTQTEEKTEVETVTQTDDKTEAKAEEKTYTQEEYNALDMKLKKKYEKKYEGIDLAKYREWQESQKTEAEKQSELNQKYTNTTNENKQLKQENLVLKANVDKEYVDYVQFKVSKMEGEFEDNLKDFLNDNPKYLQTENTTVEKEEKETDGVAVNKNTANSETGVRSILKNKHPELKF